MFEDRYYDQHEICAVLGITRHQLRGQRVRGEFPKPIQLGERTIRWLGSELEAWRLQKHEDAA